MVCMIKEILTVVTPLILLCACGTTSPEKPKYDVEETERKMMGLQQKFDLYDLDGNGLLTHEELTQGFIKAGIPDVTPEKVNKVIDFYDFNKDGMISLRETQSGQVSGAEELIKKFD